MNHNFENTLAILICLYTLKLVHQNVLLGGSLNTKWEQESETQHKQTKQVQTDSASCQRRNAGISKQC